LRPLVQHIKPGDVLELADRHDLGSCAARREGSTPSIPTKPYIKPDGKVLKDPSGLKIVRLKREVTLNIEKQYPGRPLRQTDRGSGCRKR
jgi:hypothetical protein